MLTAIDSQLRSLELKCRRPVEHLLAGEYHSIFKGRGIEFADVRPYQPGDDVRTMDWKVTARTGRPHIKRFTEEREQFIYLAVDLSASVTGDVAGQRRTTIAELAALIALAAVGNHDRVGLILFSDRVEHVVPANKGRQHALRLMEALMTFQPEGRGTCLHEAMTCLGQLARRRSVIFVISDFLATDAVNALSTLGVRHDLNAIRVFDPEQKCGDLDGLLRIRDAETGEVRLVDLGAAKSRAETPVASLREALLGRGVSLLDMPVGGDCVTALETFFRTRHQRIEGDTGG
jgi:uncharacterized protein (DUF58 family)